MPLEGIPDQWIIPNEQLLIVGHRAKATKVR